MPDNAAAGSWVLLRGLGRCAHHWGEFPQRLQANYPSALVHALDLPGLGERCHLPSPASIDSAVDAYRTQLRELGVSAPLRLVGLSMGGMVAMQWLQRYPQELSQAFVINSSAGGICRWQQRMRPAALARLLAASLSPARREHSVFDLTCNARDQRDAVLAQWQDIARQQPPRTGNLLRQINAARRFTPPALAATDKLVIVASSGDRLVDPACSAAIAAHYQRPLRLHPWAGHDLPQDDPGWLLQQLADTTAATPPSP